MSRFKGSLKENETETGGLYPVFIQVNPSSFQYFQLNQLGKGSSYARLFDVIEAHPLLEIY